MKFEVKGVTECEDGSGMLDIEIDDEFKEWFKKDQGLKQFSQARFERWVLQVLSEEINKELDSQEGEIEDPNHS